VRNGNARAACESSGKAGRTTPRSTRQRRVAASGERNFWLPSASRRRRKAKVKRQKKKSNGEDRKRGSHHQRLMRAALFLISSLLPFAFYLFTSAEGGLTSVLRRAA
jgi:hypothetical protein